MRCARHSKNSWMKNGMSETEEKTVDMPFEFDEKLAFNLPEGYQGTWKANEPEEADEFEEDDDDLKEADESEELDDDSESDAPHCRIILTESERSRTGEKFSCSIGCVKADASKYPGEVDESNFLIISLRN